MVLFVLKRRTSVIFVVYFVMLTLFSLQAYSLPDFNISVDLNKNSFYTLPLLDSQTIDFDFYSNQSGIPIDCNVSVDLIKGNSCDFWWNKSFNYRVNITQNTNPIANKTATLFIDTKSLIMDDKLRTDCKDVRLYNSYLEPISFIIENCNSQETEIRYKIPNPRKNNVWLYYGNPSLNSLINSDSAYKLSSKFDDEDSFNEYWVIEQGNIVSYTGTITSQFDNFTVVKLDNVTLRQSSELKLGIDLNTNAEFNLILSSENNVSVRSFSILFNETNNLVKTCWNVDGSSSCSKYNFDEDISSSSLFVNITEGYLDVFINDEKINNIPQYFSISNSIIFIEMNNTVSLDDFTLLERMDSSFVKNNEQKLYDYWNGVAFGGKFGFEYSVLGMETGVYSFMTKASRIDMEEQNSCNQINLNYEKLDFQIQESGYLTSRSARYFVDTEGVLIISNENDASIDVNIPFDTNLDVMHVGGTKINSDGILFNIGADSSVTIPFIISGIVSSNPTSGDKGVMHNLVSSNMNYEYYQILSSSFSKEEMMFDDIEQQERDVVEEEKKQIKYGVNQSGEIDILSFLSLTKKISKNVVEKNDVVHVTLKVHNFDPVSRFVEITDTIGDEFVLIKNNKPLDKKNISWKFKMNKESSKQVNYSIKYIGNSTGTSFLSSAKVSSSKYYIFSNTPRILRVMPEPFSVFVNKNVEEWTDGQDTFGKKIYKVTLTIINPTTQVLEDISVNLNANENTLFVPLTSSKKKGHWMIYYLPAGDTWTVSYLTDDYDSINILPEINGFSQDLDVDGEIIVKKPAKGSLLETEFNKMPLYVIIIIFLIFDLIVILFYMKNNPFFETYEEVTFVMFFSEVKKATVDFFHNFVISLRLFFIKFKKYMSVFIGFIFQKIPSVFKQTKKTTHAYYKSRNVSFVAEKIKQLGVLIKKEIKEVLSLSLKDWLLIISHGIKSIFSLLGNIITYGIFKMGVFFISLNKNSKLGRVLTYTAKTFNPELKSYVATILDKKMDKKFKEYGDEINKIDKEEKRKNIIIKIKKQVISFFENFKPKKPY